MPTRYVWWDDVSKRKRCRLDIRVPEPLSDFLRDVAKRNGVSVNALVCGMLAYMVDADRRTRLRVEVIPAVRMTESKPDVQPVVVPAPTPSPATRKRYGIPKVR